MPYILGILNFSAGSVQFSPYPEDSRTICTKCVIGDLGMDVHQNQEVSTYSSLQQTMGANGRFLNGLVYAIVCPITICRRAERRIVENRDSGVLSFDTRCHFVSLSFQQTS